MKIMGGVKFNVFILNWKCTVIQSVTDILSFKGVEEETALWRRKKNSCCHVASRQTQDALSSLKT